MSARFFLTRVLVITYIVSDDKLMPGARMSEASAISTKLEDYLEHLQPDVENRVARVSDIASRNGRPDAHRHGALRHLRNTACQLRALSVRDTDGPRHRDRRGTVRGTTSSRSS